MGIFNILAHTKDNVKIVIITNLKTGDHILLVDNKIKYIDEGLKNTDISIFEMDKPKIQKVNGEDYFIDPIAKETNLVVCGGGHVAQAFVRVAKRMNFKITALEDRLSFARALTVAGADEVIYEDFTESIKKVEGSPNTFFTILTRGHKYDLECLYGILQKKYAYIGMLSSHYRATITRKKVIEHGYSKEVADSIHAPIGLEINAKTPEEVAISIIAQIIKKKNEEICSSDMPQSLIHAIINNDCKKVLCTIIKAKGSTPRGAGTKMLVLEDGSIIGTIGGGCMEAETRQKALEVMKNKTLCTTKIDLTGRTADIEKDGLACGGIVEVLLEPICS